MADRRLLQKIESGIVPNPVGRKRIRSKLIDFLDVVYDDDSSNSDSSYAEDNYDSSTSDSDDYDSDYDSQIDDGEIICEGIPVLDEISMQFVENLIVLNNCTIQPERFQDFLESLRSRKCEDVNIINFINELDCRNVEDRSNMLQDENDPISWIIWAQSFLIGMLNANFDDVYDYLDYVNNINDNIYDSNNNNIDNLPSQVDNNNYNNNIMIININDENINNNIDIADDDGLINNNYGYIDNHNVKNINNDIDIADANDTENNNINIIDNIDDKNINNNIDIADDHINNYNYNIDDVDDNNIIDSIRDKNINNNIDIADNNIDKNIHDVEVNNIAYDTNNNIDDAEINNSILSFKLFNINKVIVYIFLLIEIN